MMEQRLRRTLGSTVVALAVLSLATAALAADFGDVPQDHIFSTEIDWLAEEGITRGCNPPDNTLFCPDDPVTRGQMAAFLVRALGLSSAPDQGFTDTTTSVFQQDIDALAAAGITRGCNPPDNTLFCPDDPVTRGQMAAFLHRALDGGFDPGPPAVDVATGNRHSCAVTEGGDVYCWGLNSSGQLGDGSEVSTGTAVAVVDLPDSTEVVAGGSHTCALTEAATVYCWGEGANGRLGNGSNAPVSSPVQVSDLSNVVALSAGESHNCAVIQAGAVYCWGFNVYGQLGDGSIASSDTPVPVPGLGGVTAVAAGRAHTCAVSSGAVHCWGDGGYLGDGVTQNSLTPIAVNDFGTAVDVAAGNRHTCAITDGGALYCWGFNAEGELGDGTTTHRESPVASGVADASMATVSHRHGCAAAGTGELHCWGAGANGRLGTGATGGVESDPQLVEGLDAITAVDSLFNHTCAVSDAVVYCWGDNSFDQLGAATTGITAFEPLAVSLAP